MLYIYKDRIYLKIGFDVFGDVQHSWTSPRQFFWNLFRHQTAIRDCLYELVAKTFILKETETGLKQGVRVGVNGWGEDSNAGYGQLI